MAIRLAKAFGATPDIWIRMQAAYDVAQAHRRADAIKVERYQPQTAA
jgi:plasmid maintenance system antidote protein VapI